MRLVTKIQDRVHEEMPGYFTAYGEDDISIGVAVATEHPDYFWYFGDASLVAVDATVDVLDKLTSVFGEPSVVPYREEVVAKSAYAKSSVLSPEQKAAEIAKYEVTVTDAKVVEAEVVIKK